MTRAEGLQVNSKINGRFLPIHGFSGHPIFRIWQGMVDRCHNPNNQSYKWYGGRGIKVCRRWRNSPKTFLNDMGERPKGLSLDRINNDGNYEPSNCRWATTKQQMRNYRRNKMITFNGETLALIDWAERLGMDHKTVGGRLRSGWSIDAALTKKPYRSKRTKTHCTNGHKFSKNNIRMRSGYIVCRACANKSAMEHMRRKRKEMRCK